MVKIAPGGPVVERSPGVLEVPGSVPAGQTTLCTASILRLDQGNMVGFLVVDCKMRLLYHCACDVAFQCGGTISATSRHRHNMIEIMLKVTLN